MIMSEGCGRLRLPAIDPYGRQIFLPAPNYTTVTPRARYGRLLPEPAFQAPPTPPSCPPGALAPNSPQPFYPDYDDYDDYDEAWPWQDECEHPTDRWWEDPGCNDDPCYDPCADSYYPEDDYDYDTCYDIDPASYDSDYCQPDYCEPAYCEPAYCESAYCEPAYCEPVPYPGYAAPVPPVPATTAVPPYEPQPYAPAPVLGAPVQDTRAAGRRMQDGELQLNPQRLVASVGWEVVLRAGLCDDDGFLIKRQLIEWSLSQESVGTIVEVDNTSRPFLRRLFHVQPEKKSTNFAVGRTSTRPQVLARGTVDTSDDIWLLEGQTWMSVSSESEGVTHITAMAPAVAGWQQRRATSTIHWVDGQWTFPPPAISGATSGQAITTRLLRASNGTPIKGWRVRYEITGGVPAAFNAEGEQVQVVDVKSDASGNANVQVVPQSAQGGTTTIKIQVIRVGTAPGDLSQLVVGEGVTSVTWTAPALAVAIAGPQFAQVGSQVTYQLNVTNSGAMAATDVDLINTIPSGLEYLNSSPSAEIFGNRLRWSLGNLGPGQTAQVTADFRVTSGGTITNCAEATTVGGVKVEDCTVMQIAEQTITIDVNGPQTVSVGQPFQYQITITNRGTQPVPDVVLVDRFESLLSHEAGRNSVEKPIGLMQPNQQEFVALTFTPVAPGRACNTVEVVSAGSVIASSRNCVDINGGIAGPPQPDPQPGSQALAVTMRGDPSVTVGGMARYRIDITNNTGTDLANVQVVDQFDDQLEAKFASEGPETGKFARRGNELRWLIANLPRGLTISIDVACEGLAEGRSCNHVIVSTPDGQEARDEVCTDILGSNAASPPQPGLRQDERPGPFDINRSDINGGDSAFPTTARHALRIPDRLAVSVERSGRLFRGPAESVYEVTIHNPRKTPASHVVLKIQLPHGLKFADSVNPPRTSIVRSGGDGQSIEFSPLLDLRAGETVRYQIIAAGDSEKPFVASVMCDELHEPIVRRDNSR